MTNICARIKEISAVCEKHGLNHWQYVIVSVIGTLLGLVGIVLFPIAFLLSFCQITAEPASAVEAINVYGYGFILDIWFWRFLTILCMIFWWVSYYTHPEYQLIRKISKDAVIKYKLENGWPWASE